MTPETHAFQLATDATLRRYRTDPDRDDLIQETALQTLAVIRAQPGKPEAFYWGVAKRSLAQVNSHDRRWTGMPKRASFYKDPLRSGVAGLTEDAMDGKDPATGFIEWGLEAVEWRTLRPRIEAAIAALSGEKTQRIARLVYYAGLTPGEAGLACGTTQSSGRAIWSSARKVLAAELADLHCLVA